MTSVWLLEAKLGNGFIYWGHFSDCRAWTTNAWDAVFFANERSAKDVLRHISKDSGDFNWQAVEHGFEDWV